MGRRKALTAEQAVALVRQLAKDGSYRFTEHALDRMHERHITATQVISVLKRGDLISGPDRVPGRGVRVVSSGSVGLVLS